MRTLAAFALLFPALSACTDPEGGPKSNTDTGSVGADGGTDGADGSDGVDPNDQDGDGVPTDTDCDDADASVGAETTFYVDLDGDGFGGPSVTLDACTAPDNATAEPSDCDDANDQISPDAPEICDDIDNDCDLLIDGDDPSVDLATVRETYVDADSDGYGDPTTPAFSCGSEEGRVDNGLDCDDSDPELSPETLWYPDADHDGFGAADLELASCEQPEGWIRTGGDCDDLHPEAFPGGAEVCGGIDEDCDGLVDEADADLDLSTTLTFYEDLDGDTWGTDATSTNACSPPSGYGPYLGDCDDTDDQINPGALDACGDGIDSDCDGSPAPVCAGGIIDATTGALYLEGDAGNDELGRSISNAGDLDGDGSEDLLIGAANFDGAAANAGGAFVAYGGTLPGSAAVADLPHITGNSFYDYLGASVAGVGDADGDGFDDILLGADGSDSPSATAGSAYLIPGGPTRWTAGATGVTALAARIFEGVNSGDAAGESVAGPGDVDGDGIADLLIGAREADPGGASAAGQVWLVYGDPTLSGVESLSAHPTFEGAAANDFLANIYSLGGGDLDGDGLADFYMGAYGVDYDSGSGTTNTQGAVYLFPGSGTRYTATTSVLDAPATLRGLPYLTGNSALGYGVSRRAEDVDGDGYRDLFIGAYYYDQGGTDAGSALLYYGGPDLLTTDGLLTDADARFHGDTSYDYCGKSLELAPDANGDGLADLLIGCYSDDALGSSGGTAWLVLGESTLAGVYPVPSVAAFGISGDVGNNLGHAVAALDWNGDGFTDLAAGAYAADGYSGAATLFLGQTGFGAGL